MMATLVLSAAGSSLGGAFGGALGPLGAATLGRAAGSIAGGLVDQQIFGRGSEAVETGRIESFRVQMSQEGTPVPRVYGRMRVGGQMIWSSDFLEHVDESRQGGKGGQKIRQYRYSVSFAVALCEGPITRIGRVWADGNELKLSDYSIRLHKGGANQDCDPLIEAIEGDAPAFRGVAYLVFEDLPLGPFGNRIPQLNVEVFREPKALLDSSGAPAASLSELVKGVALSPGSGEFSLDTEPVERHLGRGYTGFENVNTQAETPDILPALDQLEAEAPNCKAVSLIVSWFGDDLRCGRCEIRPCVENDEKETAPYSWEVNGVGRSSAGIVSQDGEGRPIYGGTPSDASVIRVIREMQARGLKVMFYPFILMDVPEGNTKVNPYTGSAPQPVFPWRGRITLDRAPGLNGSDDKTPTAASDVAEFFGQAAPSDFSPKSDGVDYAGPAEWSMRRFILHYAHLCAVAGGVDSFCIGSEMRGLTQIRDGATSYPAVDEFQSLAADVRSILGPSAKIGYAADWSEYFGHQPNDGSGDVLFHLDPLWAHDDIDFVGIDNYLPLSDWRYAEGHLDQLAGVKSVHSLDYLTGNVEGGEGYDWFYADAGARAAQTRSPIVDTAHGEDWVFRPKDLRNWWSQPHHNRPGGVRDAQPTAWTPGSKPIWFTEVGCPAVDLGANQPNVFVDPKSSESSLPYYSRGVRDDFMQRRYLEAMLGHWAKPANNPHSSEYSGRMIDLDRAFVWTWDARPWPDFPSRNTVWSDGANHRLGHWITGRLGSAPLADVVADICRSSGLKDYDVSELVGVVDGMAQPGEQTARQALQPLMMAYAFDAVESDGFLKFRHRGGAPATVLPRDDLLLSPEGGRSVEFTRTPEGDLPRAVKFTFVDGDGSYEAGATEAMADEAPSSRIESATAPIAFDAGAAQTVADRWLAEARAGREGASLGLGRSTLALEVGDVVEIEGAPGAARFRIEKAEELGRRELTLTRVDPEAQRIITSTPAPRPPKPVAVAAPLAFEFLDLPLIDDEDAALTGRFAAFAEPWTSAAALHLSLGAEDYKAVAQAARPGILGETLIDLPRRAPDLWTRDGVEVAILGGGLSSKSEQAVLNGDNIAAVASPFGGWEIIQFQEAELIGEGRYRLGGLLRGQRGTDHLIAPITPTGAAFVLLDDAVGEFPVASNHVGLPLDYRIGPAHKPHTHASHRNAVFAFEAISLRPYRPAHLRAAYAGADVELNWVRRSRVGGEAWVIADTPLGEAREAYIVEFRLGGSLLRTAETTEPSHRYLAAEIAADGAAGAIEISVSQISERFGAGPAAKVIVNV